MEINKPNALVVTTDEHYVVLLAALIKSVEKNYHSTNPLWVYIIEDKVSLQSKERLEHSINPDIIVLLWKSMDEVIPKGFHIPVDWSSYPRNIYMRLLIPYFVDKRLDRVLYLDVDMIVQKDVIELFETELDGNIIAAVRDQRVTRFDNDWGGIKNYEALGLKAESPYFNTGLLLIDIKKWIEFDVAQKVFECITKNKLYANYPDQYGLNVVLTGLWKQLDGKWNYFSDGNDLEPYIIHFVERKPIFSTYKGNSFYKDIFFGYLNETKWKNPKAVSELARYKKKIKNIISKFKNSVFSSGT